VRRAWAIWLLGAGLACAGAAPEPARDSDNYLRYVAVRMPVGGESILLRWPEKQMPLKVHLPQPPDGLFEEPEGIFDSVRDGVLDWTDVASPGVPSFVFVENPGEADIPIVWAEEPDGDWYIAFCAYEGHGLMNRLDVSHILVTARIGRGRVADLHDIHEVMLHEMGHALGLAGHSPSADDIMGTGRRPGVTALSQRDRNTLKALYARPIGTRIVGAKRDRKN
jgi:predicted Zn-dependent protease